MCICTYCICTQISLELRLEPTPRAWRAPPLPPPPMPAQSIDPTGEFPLGTPEYLFYLLFQAARQRDLRFDRALAGIGLNVHRWRTLAIIRRIENCAMKDLALYSAVDRTTLTRVVDQLVAQGLVQRWSTPRDRRRVHLMLSDAGETAYRAAMTALLSGNQAMLQGVTEGQARTAARVMAQVIRNLMDQPLEAEKLLAYGGPTGKPQA